MQSADFRNRIRQIKGLRKTQRSTISQRRNRNTPVIQSKDWERLTGAVQTLLRQGSTGGVGALLSAGGTHLRSSPKGGSSSIAFYVVRDLGDGNDPFLMAQQILKSDTNPWDGTWTLDPLTTHEKLYTFPGLLSKDYSIFLWLAPEFRRLTQAVTVLEFNGTKIALQTYKFLTPKKAINTSTYRVTDCLPIGFTSAAVAVEEPELPLPRRRTDPTTSVTSLETGEVSDIGEGTLAPAPSRLQPGPGPTQR